MHAGAIFVSTRHDMRAYKGLVVWVGARKRRCMHALWGSGYAPGTFCLCTISGLRAHQVQYACASGTVCLRIRHGVRARDV